MQCPTREEHMEVVRYTWGIPDEHVRRVLVVLGSLGGYFLLVVAFLET